MSLHAYHMLQYEDLFINAEPTFKKSPYTHMMYESTTTVHQPKFSHLHMYNILEI